MPYGYTGKVLRVDLSREKVWIEEPDELFYRKYMGGRAIVAYYLLKELETGIDPLSPNNIIVFATSVITGAPFPGNSRYTIAAKSPLTLGYGEAEAGGFWGPELKFAGYDAVVIKGRADSPVYIWIHNEDAEIRDARKLWGMITGDIQSAIRKELNDDRVRVACIGPAGEKMVRFACVISDLRHAAGRTGLGAVMGSKNLKAVAVRGTGKIKIKDPNKIREFSRSFFEKFKDHPLAYILHDLGTAKNVLPLNEMGLLPTRNFHNGYFEKAEEISGEKMKETILIRREACYGCGVACKRVVKVNEPYTVDPQYGGPEYETIGTFGSLCQISDLKAIAKANELCNKYGLDTISTGLTIAFAMECYENGIITKKETDGIDLKFGNAQAMVKLVEDIALRRGLGDILAEGSMRAAKKFGSKAEDLAMHVKGQELPAHEPRGKWAVGLGYAVSPTGADHLQAAHDVCFDSEGEYVDHLSPLGILEPVKSQSLGPRKMRLFCYLQCLWSLYNVLDLCIFVGFPEYPGLFTISDLPKIVKAVTGWETSVYELMKAGERGINMLRIFNMREGFTRNDDSLPERLFKPLESGALKGTYIPKTEFEKARVLYYEMMGWDPQIGEPTRAKKEELGIGDLSSAPMRK